MASQYRGATIYWKGRRMKSAVTGTFTPTEQGEAIYNEDGYVDMTDGAKECDVECTESVKVSGNPVILHIGDRGKLQIAPLNGQIVTIENAKVMEVPIDWDHKTGVMNGRIKWHGGEPKYTG